MRRESEDSGLTVNTTVDHVGDPSVWLFDIVQNLLRGWVVDYTSVLGRCLPLDLQHVSALPDSPKER